MDISRRHFLTKLSMIIGASALIGYCPHAFSLTHSTSEEKHYRLFEKISVLLTDNPHLSPDLMQAYFNKLYQQQNNKPFIALLNQANQYSLQDKSLKNKLTNELRQQTPMGIEIKKIITMWYFGALGNDTISADAYQKSLVWPAFDTTAPGTSSGNNWGDKPNVSI